MILIYLYIGGRGWAGAGRKGKTVLLLYIYILEEGAGREPVGGEDGESHASFVIMQAYE